MMQTPPPSRPSLPSAGEPLNVLVALPSNAAGLDQVRQSLVHGSVNVVEPWAAGTVVPRAQIADCSVLFANYPPANLADMERLVWIQLGSAGYQQLEGLPLEAMGIRVTTASGVNDVPIAEWCLTTMLMFERDMAGMLANQAAHHWERAARFQSELRGRRVGIVGYGNIGREVARLCVAFGLEVWAMGRNASGPRPHRFVVPGTGDPEGQLPQRSFRMDQMADFLPHLDYLVLCLPLTPSTKGLFGAAELAQLPRSAVLLNPSRGPLIQEGALVEALAAGRIRGAALDTHYQYPLPAEHPLWSLPNVILTPHISGSDGARMYWPRLWDLFATNLDKLQQGQPLLNEVTWAS